MWSITRSCGHVASLLRQSVARCAESTSLITKAQNSAINSSSCSHLHPTQRVAASSASNSYSSAPLLGHCFSSSASCRQNVIGPEIRETWSKLTQHQQKTLLKPDKNQNHFKRTWKQDLQIKHAHQVRRRQQAAANAARHKSLHEKWHKGAAMWRGSGEPQAASDQSTL